MCLRTELHDPDRRAWEGREADPRRAEQAVVALEDVGAMRSRAKPGAERTANRRVAASEVLSEGGEERRAGERITARLMRDLLAGDDSLRLLLRARVERRATAQGDKPSLPPGVVRQAEKLGTGGCGAACSWCHERVRRNPRIRCTRFADEEQEPSECRDYKPLHPLILSLAPDAVGASRGVFMEQSFSLCL